MSQLHLQTHDTPRLEGVGGNPIPTLGNAKVNVGIGNGIYKVAVVSTRRERPNFIIGSDFLAVHNCELPLRQKLCNIREQDIQCIPEGVRANHAKLKIARCIVLPPLSEVLVSCKATKSAKYCGTTG